MGLIRFAIDNPVKVTVGVILLVLSGLLSLTRMRVQLTPDVDRPIITVTTYWIGASPQEIEREIVERQEEKLKNVSGLEKIRSECTRNQAKIENVVSCLGISSSVERAFTISPCESQ